MAKQYEVVGAVASAVTGTSQGSKLLYFYQGAVLPDDISQESIDHLLSVGLIAVVGSKEAQAAADAVAQGPLAAPVAADAAAAQAAASKKR